MAYPTTIDSFTVNVDGVDYVLAADVNELQTAIVAAETALGISAYTAWTPVITQSGVVTHTVTFAGYKLLSTKMCHLIANLVVTGAGTGANVITISGWPSAINPYQMGNYAAVGVGTVLDTGTNIYPAIAFLYNTATAIQFHWQPTGNYLGVNPNFALANTDEITLDCLWRIV